MWFLQQGWTHWIIPGGCVAEYMRCSHSLTSITSFMTGVHLERLYVSSLERSLRLVLREKKLGYEEQKQRWATSAVKYVTKKWKGAHHREWSLSHILLWWLGLPVLSSWGWTLAHLQSSRAGWVCSSSHLLFLFSENVISFIFTVND